MAPFTGDDDPAGHIWRPLKHPGFRVDVKYCRALPRVVNPDHVAAECQTAIAASLGLARDMPRTPLPPDMSLAPAAAASSAAA